MTYLNLDSHVRRAGVLLLAACLGACSMLPTSIPFFGRDDKPRVPDLGPNTALIGVRPAWTARVGQVALPLSVHVNGTTIAVASSDGTVAAIDANTGRDLWRANAGAPVAAGVGSDGKFTAVVTRANELVTFAQGAVIWRQKLGAVAYTTPFVAGDRVFVLTADRAVSAFDGATGRKLWTQQRPGEPLVLRQNGVMLAVGDTLVVGLSGRLVGLNPSTGSVRWEAPLANPRGINDVERLVDLVGGASRLGDVVCARAFQATVGCVDAGRAALLWTRPASGAQGISGDDRLLFGTESDGRVVAWRRDNGERAWVTDRLLYRGLSAPLSLGRSVVVGDSSGLVHLLSRDDGSPLNRLTTDGSAIVAAPVLAANALVVVTRNGGIFAFSPE